LVWYNVLSCVGAVVLVALESLGASGVDGEDHAGLTVLGLCAVEPFWTGAVHCDGEGGDGGCAAVVGNRHEAREGACSQYIVLPMRDTLLSGACRSL
jgi:hypothetical protein